MMAFWPEAASELTGVPMTSSTIDLRGVTPDLIEPTDNPALTAALMEAIEPSQPMVDGAGFDNKASRPIT
jgi:hypothetical protein